MVVLVVKQAHGFRNVSFPEMIAAPLGSSTASSA
jgi:hypothetical protein